jgi:hypothetical protein
MVGLIIAIIIFNFIAFKTNKRLTSNQIFHIWTFTIAFQCIFDVMVEFKYHGYWYFDKGIEWIGILPHTVVVPPVNMMFLNWYPFNNKMKKQFTYILLFVIAMIIYEAITLLPEPWGYFHNGWWKLWHSAIIDPILLLILLGYYKLVYKAEKKLIQRYDKHCRS